MDHQEPFVVAVNDQPLTKSSFVMLEKDYPHSNSKVVDTQSVKPTLILSDQMAIESDSRTTTHSKPDLDGITIKYSDDPESPPVNHVHTNPPQSTFRSSPKMKTKSPGCPTTAETAESTRNSVQRLNSLSASTASNSPKNAVQRACSISHSNRVDHVCPLNDENKENSPTAHPPVTNRCLSVESTNNTIRSSCSANLFAGDILQLVKEQKSKETDQRLSRKPSNQQSEQTASFGVGTTKTVKPPPPSGAPPSGSLPLGPPLSRSPVPRSPSPSQPPPPLEPPPSNKPPPPTDAPVTTMVSWSMKSLSPSGARGPFTFRQHSNPSNLGSSIHGSISPRASSKLLFDMRRVKEIRSNFGYLLCKQIVHFDGSKEKLCFPDESSSLPVRNIWMSIDVQRVSHVNCCAETVELRTRVDNDIDRDYVIYI